MAQYKVIKPVNFGNFTITGPSGLQSDKVPINTYAPKVGQVIEGNLETIQVNDGNGHSENKTGIIWNIRTNGASSTQGQTSVQFISEDYFEPLQPSNTEPINPANPVNPSTPATEENNAGTPKNSECWICDNKLLVAFIILIIIILIIVALSN